MYLHLGNSIDSLLQVEREGGEYIERRRGGVAGGEETDL